MHFRIRAPLSLFLVFSLVWALISFVPPSPSFTSRADDGGWGSLIGLDTAVTAVGIGSCGTDGVHYIIYSNGLLRLYGSGDTGDFTAASPAPWSRARIKAIVVGDGVTRVGALAFSGLSDFSLYLPDSVVSVSESALDGALSCRQYTNNEAETFGALMTASSLCACHKYATSETAQSGNHRPYSLFVCTSCGFSYRVYSPLKGDLNGDLKISSADLVLLRRALAGGYGVTADPAVADLNSDGRVNAIDLLTLRRYLAGGYGVLL